MSNAKTRNRNAVGAASRGGAPCAAARAISFGSLFPVLLACVVLLTGVLALGSVRIQPAFADSASLTAGASTTVQTQKDSASILYAAHSGGKWSWVKNGAASTVGKGKLIKFVGLKVKGTLTGSVQYEVYVNGLGWQGLKQDGAMVGKAGKKKSIGAVRIALTGELSAKYDVRYQVMSSSGTWQGWKKNGQVAGKVGAKLRGIKVQLVKKGTATSKGAGIVGVRYRTKVQGSSKWEAWKADNAKAGKAGKGKRIQDLAISLDRGAYTGGIEYRVRLANGKWKPWKKNGASIGKLKNIEAVQIRLTGAIAADYDVVYRAYVSGVGWQARVRNGATAGTAKARRIEGLCIMIEKNTKRNGWVGSGSNWAYYKNGKPLANQWITTTESPINMLTAKSYKYWLDATGKLAVSRVIDPKQSIDSAAGSKLFASKWGYPAIDTVVSDGSKWYIVDAKGTPKTVSYAQAQAERYVRWAIKIANDDSHGYSQDLQKRWGKPDYDCSSLVISAVRAVGLDAGSAVYTGNMKSELTKHGFVWHSGTKNLKRGDILLVHIVGGRQHTEIYIGDNKTVGAHIAETGGVYGIGGDQTGHEIDVGPLDKSIWQGYLRFEG